MSDMIQMAADLPLFAYGKARRSDPRTSHEAAKDATFAKKHCEEIYAAMRLAGRPLAAKEIADLLGMPTHHPVNRRLSELVDGGLIEVANCPRFINPSGRTAQRYRVLA